MGLLQAVGISIATAMAVMLLRESGGKYTAAVTATGGLFLLFFFLSRFSPSVAQLRLFLENNALTEKSGLLLKAVGVGYLTQIGGDVCRDLGEQSTAAKLELCGRAELLLLCLPLLSELLSIAFSLVNFS